MKEAWSEIVRLVGEDAFHIKKKIHLSDITDERILTHAHLELYELADDMGNVYELADALGCLIHYAVRQGWSMEFLEKALLSKLKERFRIGGTE